MTLTVNSAVQAADGALTITGTDFTKTTTNVSIDGVGTPFEWISAEEIHVASVDFTAAEVTVEKGDRVETVPIIDAPETAGGTGDGTSPMTDPIPTDPPDELAISAGTWPNPIDTFRSTVAGVALVGLIPVGDEKTAYPTGTQLGSGKKFWLRNGYYLSATPT